MHSIDRPLPFALPDIGPEEIARVVKVLKSGWLTTGHEARRFEEQFSQLMGGRHCLAVNSATSGFELIFHGLGIGPGDEVLSSCWTFSSPVMAAWKTGARPVLVDVEPETLNLDIERLRQAITPRTKGIVVTHFAGLPARMTEIVALARRRNLWVVEDAAHALPATHDGKLIGTLDTTATVFSFYATKSITTGEGGMVVTADTPLFETMRRCRLHGIDRDMFDRYSSPKTDWEYEVGNVGFKSNLTDIAAALGNAQLPKLYLFHERRRQIAEIYDRRFADADSLRVPAMKTTLGTSAYHLYVLRQWRTSRDEAIGHLRMRGIGASVHFKPLHLHKFYQMELNATPQDCPVATAEFEKVISLPIYSKMELADAHRVADAILEIAPEGQTSRVEAPSW
jgi:dTDP-4-amino-4,6-dideoxygalactose transaminase